MHMRFPDLPQTPPRAIAVAGIAQPQRFLDALPGPFELMASFTYPDHHPYSERDVRHWVQAAHHHRANLLVTTEKDAMRIQPLSAVLHPLEMMTLGLEVQFFLAQTFQKWLEQKVTQIEEGGR
jgi:tetraacyldisaccharide 4'-kinase